MNKRLATWRKHVCRREEWEPRQSKISERYLDGRREGRKVSRHFECLDL